MKSSHWLELRAEGVVAAAADAERHARTAHDDALASELLQFREGTLALGPTHADEAVRQVRAMLASSSGHVADAQLGRVLGRLLAMRGEFDAAREHVRAGLDVEREAGLVLQAAASAMVVGFVELRAGELATAERVLRDGIEKLEQVGGESYKWTTTLIALNALQGFLLAQAGNHSEGEQLAARAAEVASRIDFYETEGQAFEWHARTLALVGKPAEASEAAALALAVNEAKGDAPASAWTRELLDSLSA